jgi:NAD+ synthase
LNYAVIGTPNRLEYDQGFFVKNGDGSSDLKPIAHLYKTQVYALAKHLGLPKNICQAIPTTDTYSLPQGQDEFYFALPYQQMDKALWAHNCEASADEMSLLLELPVEQAKFVIQDINNKRKTTAYLHAKAYLMEEVRW